MIDRLRPEQTLTETWEAVITRAPWWTRHERHHRCRVALPRSTQYATSGCGRTVDEARVDALLHTAAALVGNEDEHVDPDTLRSLARAVRRAQRRQRA